jgi:hypothetical protein
LKFFDIRVDPRPSASGRPRHIASIGACVQSIRGSSISFGLNINANLAKAVREKKQERRIFHIKFVIKKRRNTIYILEQVLVICVHQWRAGFDVSCPFLGEATGIGSSSIRSSMPTVE